MRSFIYSIFITSVGWDDFSEFYIKLIRKYHKTHAVYPRANRFNTFNRLIIVSNEQTAQVKNTHLAATLNAPSERQTHEKTQPNNIVVYSFEMFLPLHRMTQRA